MRGDLLKAGLCTIVFLLTTISTRSQSLPASASSKQTSFVVAAKVDERVELMSIIARLAGYEEYVRNDFKVYASDVDQHFAKYKQHPAVQYAIRIRATRDVAFDAVMSMAVHLSAPPTLSPRVPFTDQVPDSRWGKEGAEEFVVLVQRFYRETDSHRFFQSHADLYKTAEHRFQLLLNKVDFEWYRRFHGELPNGSFNLYIGLLNGGGNYGPKVVHPDDNK